MQLMKEEGGNAAKEKKMMIKTKGALLSVESKAPCTRQ